jgi:hypothetical protein
MDIDYVVDKKGNKYKVKTFVNYGAIVTTCILPELKPIDNICYAQNGYSFNRWRDPEYRGDNLLNNNMLMATVDVVKKYWFLPTVDSIIAFVHPTNAIAAKWTIGMGGHMGGNAEIDGDVFEKYVVPIDGLVKMADKVKCLETSLTKS